MGFLKPELPELDIEEWSKGSRSEKIRPMAKHWAEVGFGTPVVLHLFYVGKILLYILFAWLLAVPTTRGLAFTNVMSWYSEPIVFEKVVLYTMLFEVIGLGCGFGPLNNRFNPPMGSILYWLRPDTIRLPPWPKLVPATKGTAPHPGGQRAVRPVFAGDFPGAVRRRHRPGARLGHPCRVDTHVADRADPVAARGAGIARQGDLLGRPR